MTRDSNSDPAPDYDWPLDDRPRDDVEHVGLLEKGTNVFYQPANSMFFTTEIDEERRAHTFVEGSERELNPEETPAEAIESIGETTGWDSLSEWAEEHLESGEK
ncbi:hypothetical protein [Haloarchaeobius sp. HME9146]|uniref:hypothetical protein n=1 Tax=Haloarchaeobius sp. HME9146 TaxID=2978732 RepID=UPI0021C015E6|nr:hypothetical protein [Haloarchaeobius sp. HME9146]MCT9097586.1 hypothetical protein [Haloarchaeobius sp. HME9146]